jgi:hypothetical protein
MRAMGGALGPPAGQVDAGGTGWPCDLAQGHPGHYGQLRDVGPPASCPQALDRGGMAESQARSAP